VLLSGRGEGILAPQGSSFPVSISLALLGTSWEAASRSDGVCRSSPANISGWSVEPRRAASYKREERRQFVAISQTSLVVSVLGT
jgi:hypothetical protein